MSDASNIMSFYGEVNVKGSVGYSVELWIFKPQPTGQQVRNTLLIIFQTCILDYILPFKGKQVYAFCFVPTVNFYLKAGY